MNELNQRMIAIKQSKEIISNILPSITNPDVKKSLETKKQLLNCELEKIQDSNIKW